MSRLRFTLLLCSTAIISTPVMADASLDELKAKLEKAEKENIVLKTEKLERENVTMKLEKIEAENAALRNEAKVDKTPTASIPSQQHASAPAYAPQAKTVARREVVETNDNPQREHASTKAINKALAAIPKDDERREMTAVHKAQISPEIISEKPWQGVYVGINAGYGGNIINTSTASYEPVSNVSQAGVGTSSLGVGGPLAGGQVGYNHQFANHIVLGVESDLDYADINNFNGARNNSNANAIGFYGGNYTTNFTNYDRLGLNWLGTTRIRLGYALGNFLPYISGGIAYGQLTSSLFSTNSFSDSYNCGTNCSASFLSGAVTTGNNATTQVGWALGGGAEYRLADAWSIKGEYLYTSLGGITRNDTTIGTGGIVAFGQTTTGAYNLHQIRVGLNYHTGWLGAAPSVAAKY